MLVKKYVRLQSSTIKQTFSKKNYLKITLKLTKNGSDLKKISNLVRTQ